MRACIRKFQGSESGASLVEYSMTLVIVTIVMGSGLVALAQNVRGIVEVVCVTTGAALGDVVGSQGAMGCGTGSSGASSGGSDDDDDDDDDDDHSDDDDDDEDDDEDDDDDRRGNGNGNGNGNRGNGNGRR